MRQNKYPIINIIIWFFVIISLIVSSCKRNEDKKYLKENITNLLGKQIVFPDTVSLLKDNGFTRIKTLSVLGSRYTIVKRITADCPRCIHNMQLFKEKISDNLDTSVVKSVFIIYTDFYRQFRENILPEIKEIQPLIIDTLNQFVLENDLPLFDTRFHTFLLDSQRKIILIGDPVHTATGKLYQDYIHFK